MKKPINRNILIAVCLLYALIVPAQSSQENLEKYWNYRDRFKKYFVKLGSDAGEGLQLTQRCSKNNGFSAETVHFTEKLILIK